MVHLTIGLRDKRISSKCYTLTFITEYSSFHNNISMAHLTMEVRDKNVSGKCDTQGFIERHSLFNSDRSMVHLTIELRAKAYLANVTLRLSLKDILCLTVTDPWYI